MPDMLEEDASRPEQSGEEEPVAAEKPVRLARLANFLTSSWTLLGAIIISLILVKYRPDVAAMMRPFGEAYLNLLQMTIIPFAVSATVSSLARLMRDRKASHLVRRTVIWAAGFFMIIVVYGVAIAVLFGPAMEPSDDTYAYIGEVMFKDVPAGQVADNWAIFEIDSRQPGDRREADTLEKTLLESIPVNVFRALSDGNMVKILIFFALFAFTARYMPEDGYTVIQSFSDGVLASFIRILDWLYLLAAPGIACIIANTFADADPSLIWKFKGFIAVLLGGLLVCLILCFVIVWLRSGHTFLTVLQTIQDSLFIAAAANSELLAMPRAMDALDHLGFDKKVVNVVMPLSVNLIPNGSAVIFAIAAVFCTRLYHIPLGLDAIMTLVLTIPLAAIATVQSGPLVWYGFLSITLSTFGIAIGPTLIVLYAIDFIVDRVASTLEVCTAAALVSLVEPSSAYVAKREEKLRKIRERKSLKKKV